MKKLILCALLLSPLAACAQPKIVQVSSSDQLRAALRGAVAGTEIRIAPGDYEGGIYAQNLRGTAQQPIVITGADEKNPPHFRGGGNGFHISGAAHIELRHLKVSGARDNGFNIDDGGTYTQPSHHVTLKNISVSDIGPKGNHDGMKLSGLDDFRIENCRIEKWGVGSGSGIDMVGCHRGVIENNIFVHEKEAAATGGSGVQAKGGCREIAIRKNRFENAGTRAINIGGSTGLQFFRPPLNDAAQWPGGFHEAKDIRVEGNTFIGSLAPLAFVGVDGATVKFNTIFAPGRWAMRILQETTQPGFVPSRKGVFTDNIVAFRAANWVEGGVNIGPNTEPGSFEFARNFWFCVDNAARSRPTLPSPEKEGVYGVDPQFENAEAFDLRLKETSPARKVGAAALE
jgi:hypothetical protein